MIANSFSSQNHSTRPDNDAPDHNLPWPGQFSVFDAPPTLSPAQDRAVRLPPHPRLVVEDDPFAADEGHIRFDLVDRVRDQIAQGLYERDDKIDALLDRLALDLGSWQEIM